MIETIKKIFTLPDLRNRILFTFLLLLICRILAHLPLPGVDLANLRSFFARNQIFGLLNMFSGGAMENFSLVMMGVGPYITASIVMQLLTMVSPALSSLQKEEGEWGRQKINQYTRYLTLPLSFIQSYGMIVLLRNQQIIIATPTPQLITMLIAITTGTILYMWLGELISERGIGNGISLIITLGIIAGIPTAVRNTLAVIEPGKIFGLILFLVLAILTVGLIILATIGERRIPVSYARRSIGGRFQAIETHLPIRVNSAGVIPIIFAISMMIFPGVVARFFTAARSPALSGGAAKLSSFFQNDIYYGIVYFLLVIFFTYFYTAVIFQPKQIAENLQKQGGFVPGVRPGPETANHLGLILNRITLAGAIFLGVIAVLPFIVQAITQIQTLVLGGTGILIMVSVILETARQIKAQIVMRTYEKFY